jgi:hypothetical protein
MIGLAKDGSLAARRAALGYVYDKSLVHALFEQVRERERRDERERRLCRKCARDLGMLIHLPRVKPPPSQPSLNVFPSSLSSLSLLSLSFPPPGTYSVC